MNPIDISLYGIADPARTKGRNLAALTGQAAAGGATLIQYRNKTGSTREMIEEAAALRDVLSGTDIPLLINDRVDVALAMSADGVHVGQSDMPAAQARKLLGTDALIGLTVKTIADVATIDPDDVDYVCIGGVFATLSKDNPSSIGVDGWQDLAEAVRQKHPRMPVGAIAGIDQSNAAKLIEAGADGVAIISAIFMADDPRKATQDLSQIIATSRAELIR